MDKKTKGMLKIKVNHTLTTNGRYFKYSTHYAECKRSGQNIICNEIYILFSFVKRCLENLFIKPIFKPIVGSCFIYLVFKDSKGLSTFMRNLCLNELDKFSSEPKCIRSLVMGKYLLDLVQNT